MFIRYTEEAGALPTRLHLAGSMLSPVLASVRVLHEASPASRLAAAPWRAKQREPAELSRLTSSARYRRDAP